MKITNTIQYISMNRDQTRFYLFEFCQQQNQTIIMLINTNTDIEICTFISNLFYLFIFLILSILTRSKLDMRPIQKQNALSKHVSFNCEKHSQTATAAALLKSSRFTNLTHALIFAHSHVCSKMRVDILAESIYFRSVVRRSIVQQYVKILTFYKHCNQ